MPAFLKTKEDERLWAKAKGRAEEEGQKGNYAYVTGIWKRMKGKEAALRVAGRWLETRKVVTPAEYKGRFPVVEKPGRPSPYGIFFDDRQLPGVRLPYGSRVGRPSANGTPPVGTPEKAEADANAELKSFEAMDFMGNMGDVVGLVYWKDLGLWSGLVNKFHSDT